MLAAICVCCFIVACANAYVMMGGPTMASSGNNMAYGNAGYGDMAYGNIYGGAGMAGRQASQGSQGRIGGAAGYQRGSAYQQAGRYDHQAGILVANERTHADAQMAGGNLDRAAGMGGAQYGQYGQGSAYGAAGMGGANYGAGRVGNANYGNYGGYQQYPSSGYGVYAYRPAYLGYY